jgi:hypothetical protein
MLGIASTLFDIYEEGIDYNDLLESLLRFSLTLLPSFLEDISNFQVNDSKIHKLVILFYFIKKIKL